jgi:hypothetical protein
MEKGCGPPGGRRCPVRIGAHHRAEAAGGADPSFWRSSLLATLALMPSRGRGSACRPIPLWRDDDVPAELTMGQLARSSIDSIWSENALWRCICGRGTHGFWG